MNKYVEFINEGKEVTERNSYSFTCSTKNLEERVIIAYMDYLKDNNVAYGRLLKDVLYNSSVNLFELSLPKKKCSVSIVNEEVGKGDSNSNIDLEAILRNTDNILKQLTDQCSEISELKAIIKQQESLIERLQSQDTMNRVSVDSDYQDENEMYVYEEE